MKLTNNPIQPFDVAIPDLLWISPFHPSIPVEVCGSRFFFSLFFPVILFYFDFFQFLLPLRQKPWND
jgi:hypothetical protein